MALEDVKFPQKMYAVVSLLQGHSNQISPLLSGQISECTEILKYYYFVPLKKGHPSYQARYQTLRF
jgi:hypothetical protein